MHSCCVQGCPDVRLALCKPELQYGKMILCMPEMQYGKSHQSWNIADNTFKHVLTTQPFFNSMTQEAPLPCETMLIHNECKDNQQQQQHSKGAPMQACCRKCRWLTLSQQWCKKQGYTSYMHVPVLLHNLLCQILTHTN